MTAEDHERLAANYAIGAEHSVAEGVATLLASMLADPDFLYDRMEGNPEDDFVELAPHETATRLARVLWNSVPDERLWSAAETGLDEATLRAEAERMLDDPRARVALEGFFFDLLELEALPFAPESLVPESEDRTALRESMAGSVLAFASGVVLNIAQVLPGTVSSRPSASTAWDVGNLPRGGGSIFPIALTVPRSTPGGLNSISTSAT